MVKTCIVVYFKRDHYSKLATAAFTSAKHFHKGDSYEIL